MTALRALLAQREARLALAVWALLPTIFLFFALTLAVDPTTQLGKVRLGVVVLDTGVQTPQGPLVAGSKLVAGLRQQLPFQLVDYPDENALRAAVLAREVTGGIVFPADMTSNLQAHQPVALRVVKSDANDPFSSALMTNIAGQLTANLNSALPVLLGNPGQAATPAPPLVSVTLEAVATSSDFRLATLPAVLVLPLWVATLACSVLLTRAGDRVRRDAGRGAVATGLVELALSAAGAVIVAAVITLDLALFMWRGDLDLVGLFGLLWVGLVASAWLVQGTIRLVGLELGVLLGVIALFVQQSVAGATMPSAFAPDIVRWAADVAPLRYLIEGLRNVLIGGSTTSAMVGSLALLGGAGLVLFALGSARLALLPRRVQSAPAAPPA